MDETKTYSVTRSCVYRFTTTEVIEAASEEEAIAIHKDTGEMCNWNNAEELEDQYWDHVTTA